MTGLFDTYCGYTIDPPYRSKIVNLSFFLLFFLLLRAFQNEMHKISMQERAQTQTEIEHKLEQKWNSKMEKFEMHKIQQQQ